MRTLECSIVLSLALEPRLPHARAGKQCLRQRVAQGCGFIILLAGILNCSAGGGPVSLEGRWRFAEGFETAWIEGLPESEKKTLEIPARLGKQVTRLAGYRGWITLQTEIPADLVARAQSGESLALRTGWTADVIRVYAGSRLIAALGEAEPYRSAQFRYVLTDFPSGFAAGTRHVPGENARHFLTVALYSPGDTELELSGPIEIGPSMLVYRSFWLGEAGSLGIIAMYSTVGIFYVLLGLRRLQQERFSLYFGLLCLTACVYWFMRTGMRDLVFGDAVLLRIKVEYIVLLALPPLFLIFVTQFLERRYTRPHLSCQHGRRHSAWRRQPATIESSVWCSRHSISQP